MFEQLKQLFWSAFGAPAPAPAPAPVRKLEQEESDDILEVIEIERAELDYRLFSRPVCELSADHVPHDDDKLEKLCKIYGDERDSNAYLLLRPLFSKSIPKGGSWIATACINDFFGSLVTEYCKKGLNVDFVKSDICILGSKNFIINRWALGLDQKFKSRVSQADLIFCPVNLSDNHWGLWVLDKRDEHKHRVYCLDGFNSNPFAEPVENYAKHQAAYYIKYIQPLAETFEFDSSQSYHHRILAQENTIDCGSVICYWAKQICENTNVPIDVDLEAKDYTAFRLEIAKTILAHHPDVVKKRAAEFDSDIDDIRPSKKARRSNH